MNVNQVLADFNQKLEHAAELLRQNSYVEAEQGFREAMHTIPPPLWRSISEIDRLHIESYCPICLFFLARYQEAIDILTRSSTARRRTGVIDREYVQQLRFLALAYRGKCEFDRCVELLQRTRGIAGKIAEVGFNPQEFISTLDNDLKQTQAIRNNEPMHKFHVVVDRMGAVSGQSPGVDLVLPRSSLDCHCKVTQIELEPLDLYRLRVRLAFTLDNSRSIEMWDGDDVHLANRIPMLFAFLLPRDARVNHGSFELRVNDPDPDWQEKHFFLENQFLTIFHPDSYPRLGYHPVPICKSYQYVQGDCSIFRSRLPKHTSVRFTGVIDFPPLPDEKVSAEHERLCFVVLPYGRTSVVPVRVLPDDRSTSSSPHMDDLDIQSVAFVTDQDSFEGPGLRRARDYRGVIQLHALQLGEGRLMMAACDDDQLAREDSTLGHGVFTYYLLDTLTDPAYLSETVTIGQLYDRVYRKVETHTLGRQTPIINGQGRGVQIPLLKLGQSQ